MPQAPVSAVLKLHVSELEDAPPECLIVATSRVVSRRPEILAPNHRCPYGRGQASQKSSQLPALVSVMDSSRASVAILEQMQIVKYFPVSSIALLAYDYFLTFQEEMSLVWWSPWSVIKILFLLTRYLPFVELGIILHFRSHPVQIPSDSTCRLFYKAASLSFFFGTALVEIMLTLRTWAVWNKDRRLAIGLPIFFLVCWGPSLGIIIAFTKSIIFGNETSRQRFGCLVVKGSHIIGIAWTLLLVYEAGIFLLMLIKAIQCYRSGGRSQLLHVVFGNGLLYYLYLFGFALANVIVLEVVPPHLRLIFISTERVIHVILGCRVILEIRGVVDKTHSVAADTVLSSAPMIPIMVVRRSSETMDGNEGEVGPFGQNIGVE